MRHLLAQNSGIVIALCVALYFFRTQIHADVMLRFMYCTAHLKSARTATQNTFPLQQFSVILNISW